MSAIPAAPVFSQSYGDFDLMSMHYQHDGGYGSKSTQHQIFDGFGITVNVHIPPPMLHPSGHQCGHWGPNVHVAQPYLVNPFPTWFQQPPQPLQPWSAPVPPQPPAQKALLPYPQQSTGYKARTAGVDADSSLPIHKLEEDPVMAKSRDDSSTKKAGNNHSPQRRKRKPKRQSDHQSQDLEASISAFMVQLSELQRPDQALEEQSQHTQDPSQSARDNTRPTSHAQCAVRTGCKLPSSLAEGWVALRQFETELAAWDSGQAPFSPLMPESCLIHWFCTVYEDIAQMWQQLEPGLQRATGDFWSPG